MGWSTGGKGGAGWGRGRRGTARGVNRARMALSPSQGSSDFIVAPGSQGRALSRGMSRAQEGAGVCGGGSLLTQPGFHSLPQGVLLEGLLTLLHSTRVAKPLLRAQARRKCIQRARPHLTKLLCDGPSGHGGTVLCCPLVRAGASPLQRRPASTTVSPETFPLPLPGPQKSHCPQGIEDRPGEGDTEGLSPSCARGPRDCVR